LLQITGNGEKAYLIDAEIDPTVAKEHFQKIYELIHEDAVEVKEILFVPRGTVDSVDHVTEEKHADVYQR
jgi:ethanolamine ammonia-lyase small subunit